MSSRLTQEVLLALVTSLDPQPRQTPPSGITRTVQPQDTRGLPAWPQREAGLLLSWSRKLPEGPRVGQGEFGEPRGRPCSCIRPRARCLRPPLPAELRRATPAAALKRLCSPCTWPGVWHPDSRHHPDHEGSEAEGGRGGGELQGSWAAEA